MFTIGTSDGEVEVNSIIGMYISEENSEFKINLVCTDGVRLFAKYPTREKAERFFYDLAMKIDYSQRRVTLPSNFLLA